MKYVRKLMQVMAIVAVVLAGAVATPAVVSAAPSDVFQQSCTNSGGTSAAPDLCADTDKALFGPNSIVTDIVNTFIYIIGGVSVVMIVIGGFKYVLSGGDSSGVASAKNTILYAVVGLAIAVLAYSIVNFVLSRL